MTGTNRLGWKLRKTLMAANQTRLKRRFACGHHLYAYWLLKRLCVNRLVHIAESRPVCLIAMLAMLQISAL